MKNNSHRDESREKRLLRLQNGTYVESIENLLSSLDNFFNDEIKEAAEARQTSLLFLGIHAASLTISEVFFGVAGLTGYKRFLELFVDLEEGDKRFSTIAPTIHNWRNVLAHQWLGSIGHTIGYDYGMQYGWEKRGGITFINPQIYCSQYLEAFKARGKIWSYKQLFSEEELEAAKARIISKYLKK